MSRTWHVVAASVLAYAAMMIDGVFPPGGGLDVAHGTIEEPIDSAVLRVTNAIDQPVDVYVNHAAAPAITDVKSLSVGPDFQVKGEGDTPYGAYTFSARPKADPGAPVIAEASVVFQEGKSFSAVLHETGAGNHQMAIYEDDFSPTGDALLTVRHNARAQEVSWRLVPKDQNTGIPHDEREGTLGNGQWQVAIDVTQNDYVLDFRVDGELVARHPDLELEHEKNRVVSLVGDPQPTADPTALQRHLVEQEFQVPLGPAQPDEVTAPQGPLSTTDDNAPIAFTCDAIELWQTNPATAQVSAVDPDGVITGLALDRVDPPAGGIRIEGGDPSPAIGEPAAATLAILSDVPAGDYDVTVVANRGSYGEQATCTLPVVVRAITIPRLRALVSDYRASGDVENEIADRIERLLDQAQQDLDAGATTAACESLKGVVATVGSEKGKGVSEPAADRLERETNALRADLGCG